MRFVFQKLSHFSQLGWRHGHSSRLLNFLLPCHLPEFTPIAQQKVSFKQ